ncbi:MAG: putative sulfate exporter family transporter [Planctomycetaceae bacterium]|nr:putative sulfate exporter family transporter [Planctomycetaceae bacterium]
MKNEDSPELQSSADILQPDIVVSQPRTLWEDLKVSEDWWAIYVGGFLLLCCFLAVYWQLPGNLDALVAESKAEGKSYKLTSPLKSRFDKPGTWGQTPPPSAEQGAFRWGNPLDAFKSGDRYRVPGIFNVFLVCAVLFGFGQWGRGKSAWAFVKGFWFVFLLALLAYVLSQQAFVSYYNLEYALWALSVGLLISNTLGTPQFVRPALLTEFYIKSGLVLLGAEVLISRLIELGVPGIFVAWVVTPIVLISTYIFGQKVLKMESRSLNMVISADMSVCGVSAAIATAAACRAKKEELSLAIGMSLSFTVIMMVLMPALIKFMGLSPVLGGAWLGGTIDSTGAVAAAGGILGDVALEVAATVKMIQNILIGVTAFGVAVYWVTFVEAGSRAPDVPRPGVSEIWRRFPKFVLGFVGASLVFSWVYLQWDHGPLIVNAVVKDTTGLFRGWFFCLAFVSIGLDTNFRELARYLRGGKPLLLYVCGQSLNLVLTLCMAWLMFEVVFKEMTSRLLGK